MTKSFEYVPILKERFSFLHVNGGDSSFNEGNFARMHIMFLRFEVKIIPIVDRSRR
ncbi:hypothetical protein Syun_021079 [Stephania yunnanensis]|uniref:Uncharacterized protein n=1 Tax=Stephania yunnanensis TaxID=152371 RepID=A0AAP0IFD9_9MAGN